MMQIMVHCYRLAIVPCVVGVPSPFVYFVISTSFLCCFQRWLVVCGPGARLFIDSYVTYVKVVISDSLFVTNR